MRLLTGLLFAGAFTITGVVPRQAVDADGTIDRSVLALRIVRDAGNEYGTAVLIHREDRGDNALLYFLTSSCLFRTADGEPLPRARAVELLVDETRTLDVKHEDLFMPVGSCVDVAVFRVTAAATTTLAPRPVVYDAPSAGADFLVSGYDRNGLPATLAGHIRFRSTLLASGDRDVSVLRGCVGAPAISQEGVFGIVSQCAANRSPVISLLSMARGFIERNVPRPITDARPISQLDFRNHEMAGLGCRSASITCFDGGKERCHERLRSTHRDPLRV